MSSSPTCHCDESGFYHCSELREKLEDMRKVIQLILETDALQSFAYERGDDDMSIYDLCKAALKFPDAPDHDDLGGDPADPFGEP